MTTKQLALAGLVAALYAALTLALAPISYGPVQFRLAEALKPLALFDPCFILAFAVGNLASNLFSPYIGGWELVWMPCANVLGAWLCWRLRRWLYAGALAYAAVVSLAVSVMLHFVTGLPWLALLGSVGVSETVLIMGAVPLVRRLWRVVAGAGGAGEARVEG